ncbi:MAG: NF038104 family lipoprotein [Mariprofundus sp.]|nr:NF038104 family lipoprotein [Mariprofundus sp.]
MKKTIPLLLLLSLSGCLGTVVGAAVDVTTEVIKVPFKVGGAIIDGVTGDDEESASEND